MDYFAAMRAFTRTVELGSFSNAAAEEGVKVSTVSRYVTALEADLSAALLNRSTRHLHLTEVGSSFYESAVRILADVADARLAATSLNVRPQGMLRTSVPGAFGRRHIIPHVPAFLDLYPEIQINVTLTDEAVDLIVCGADCAVRIGALADSTLIARRLAPQRRALVASPSYLARHPAILKPRHLESHDCLSFALQFKQTWCFHRQGDLTVSPVEVTVSGRMRADDPEVIMDVALAGVGLALLPTWLVSRELTAGRLVAVLPQWEASIAPGAETAVWFVYPPKKIVAPKVRAFMTFLEEKFARPPHWDPNRA